MIKIKKFDNGKREYWSLTTPDGNRKFAMRLRFSISPLTRRSPYAVEICRCRPAIAGRYYTASAFYYTGIPTHPHVIKVVSKDIQGILSDLLVLCIEYARVGLSRQQRDAYVSQHNKIKALLEESL